MVIELILALATLSLTLSIHLGHLLQALKHGCDDPLVVGVDDFANV